MAVSNIVFVSTSKHSSPVRPLNHHETRATLKLIWLSVSRRLDQEVLIRFAEVGYHTFNVWASGLLRTLDEQAKPRFRPWLPLEKSEKEEQRKKITDLPVGELRTKRQEWLKDVLS
jgi:hypothetical protein